MVSPPNMCIYCKGSRAFCGLNFCPIISKFNMFKNVDIKNNFYGRIPSIFVGRKNYPKVFLGPLTTANDKLDIFTTNPSKLYGMKYKKIIEISSFVLRGKRRGNIKKIDSTLTDIALSSKPIFAEMRLNKITKSIVFSRFHQPIGISAYVQKIQLSEEPKIKRVVYRATENDLKADYAVNYLYRHGFDVYKISDILSVGALGIEKKMVPTRWSITAVDDIVFKSIIKDIKGYKNIDKFMLFHNTYINNNFVIIILPGSWEFENFESWAPHSIWAMNTKNYFITHEYEGYMGRKEYAEKQTGGYYATRLAVAEFFKRIKKQGKVIVIREVGEGYIFPLGVWVVRESVRGAFQKKPQVFSNLNEMLKNVSSFLRIDISKYVQMSTILSQTSLNLF